jgi:sulfur relay (sulfurtransferase) DsrC/TusE family protein
VNSIRLDLIHLHRHFYFTFRTTPTTTPSTRASRT